MLPISGVLLLAGAWDVLRRRIPNRVTLVVAVAGGVFQLLARGPLAAGLAVLGAVGVVVLLWSPWVMGRIGGGDLKLAAAAAISAGLGDLAWYLLGSSLAAGGLSAISYACSSPRARAEIRGNLHLAFWRHPLELNSKPVPGSGRVSVPFGAAFVIAALFLLWTRNPSN